MTINAMDEDLTPPLGVGTFRDVFKRLGIRSTQSMDAPGPCRSNDILHPLDASCKGNPGSLVLEDNGTLTWTPLQEPKSTSCPSPCDPKTPCVQV